MYTRLTEGSHKFNFAAPDKIEISNTGYTLNVTAVDSFFGAKDFGNVNLPAGTFTAKEYHFHFPAEHKITASVGNSGPEAGEMQIMFKDAQSHGYVGLSILLRSVESETSMFKRHVDFFDDLHFKHSDQYLHQLGSRLPTQAGKTIVVDKKIDLAEAFLPDLRGSYYHYTGSLTSPPCTEGVHWYVVQVPVNVSWTMLQNAKDAILEAGKLQAGGNNRALQPSHGRKVILDALATDKTDTILGAAAVPVATTTEKATFPATTPALRARLASTSTSSPVVMAAGGSSFQDSLPAAWHKPLFGSSSVSIFTILCIVSGCCCCLLATGGIAIAMHVCNKKKKPQRPRKEYFAPIEFDEEEEDDDEGDLTQTRLVSPQRNRPVAPLESHYQAEAPVVAQDLQRTVYVPVSAPTATAAPAAAPASSYYQRPAFNK
jgi:carbonic anhydrase